MGSSKRLIYLLLTFVVSSALGFSQELILTGAKVYPSPTATPIENATVVVHEGKIVSVGTGKVRVEKGAEAIDCT